MVVRELTGGIYFGEKGATGTPTWAPLLTTSSSTPRARCAASPQVAFDMAMKRSKHVTSVDKANVLESSRLWRRVVRRGGPGLS